MNDYDLSCSGRKENLIYAVSQQRYGPFRPTEVDSLQGNASKARKTLGWEPRVRFKDLVRMMVNADMKALEEMKQCQDVIRKLSNNKNQD